MISHKFSIAPEDKIAGFMSDESGDEDSILEYVESVSDLWLLANMKESYEESYLHRAIDSNAPDVFSPHGGEDASGFGNWTGRADR